MPVYPDHVVNVPLEADRHYWRNRAVKAEDDRADMLSARNDQARGALVGMAAVAISAGAVGFVLGWLL